MMEELSCGWCTIPLAELKDSSKTTIVKALQGGTPSEPVNIKDDEVMARRTGWRYVAQQFRGSASPSIRIEAKPVADKLKSAARYLPSMMLCAERALPLVHTFQKIYAEAIHSSARRRNAIGAAVIMTSEPALSVFPHILDEPTMLNLLLENLKKSGVGDLLKKNLRTIRKKFCHEVMSLWPAFCRTHPTRVDARTLQPIIIGGMAVDFAKENMNFEFDHRSPFLVTATKEREEADGDTPNSTEYAPFHASELLTSTPARSFAFGQLLAQTGRVSLEKQHPAQKEQRRRRNRQGYRRDDDDRYR